MYILCAKECKCDIADWEGYIGTTRVHSLAGTKMRDRQIWGVNLPPAYVRGKHFWHHKDCTYTRAPVV